MSKLIAWLTDRSRDPVSLLLFGLGAVLVLLGVTNGFSLPVLQQLAPDERFRWVAVALGTVFVVIGAFIAAIANSRQPAARAQGVTEESNGKADGQRRTSIPEELTWKYAARRARLSSVQQKMLHLIEMRAVSGRRVGQDAIEVEFQRMGSREVYYRLECLRLLGLIAKQQAGTDSKGLERWSYTLAEDYERELGGPMRPPPPG